ncbi:MAG: hypothetical protein ACLR56_08730 [Oscillospiraceae bacterium]
MGALRSEKYDDVKVRRRVCKIKPKQEKRPMKCSLCPRRCNAERTENKNLNGFVKCPAAGGGKGCSDFWSRISGKNGSRTVFSPAVIGLRLCQN